MRVPLPVRAIPSLTQRAWFTPPPIGSRTVARDQEATADLQSFRVGDIAGFEVGSGPLVLALHGWGGRPAQMATLARALADAGYRVVVPELPGHAGGEPTDLKEVAAVVGRLIDEDGEPIAVVGHSFASLVMRYAFRDRAPGLVVMIAPALDVNNALDVFGDRLRLLPWARTGLRNRLEAWDPTLWPLLSNIYPEQLPGARMLILHDPDDENTSFRTAAELAALRPETDVVPMPGTGHARILSDDAVVEQVVRFVTPARAGIHPSD